MVARKTKPKNGHRHRKEQSGEGNAVPGGCRNIGIWVAIASNVGWLLILSYIVSMVHSEYAQLDRQQTKLTAIMKTLPDEWHDKAHTLEVNQSTLIHKLFDMQQTMQNLTDDLLQLRAFVQQQQTQLGDVGRVAMLEKNVADFGASLKSFSSEMDAIKNRSARLNEAVEEHTRAIEWFRAVVVAKRLNETNSSGVDESGSIAVDALNNTTKQMQELRNVTQAIADRLERVNATFTSYAAAETQKVDELEKNHTRKINELNDSVGNITAQDVNQAMKNYQDQIKALGERLTSVEKVAGSLQVQGKSVEELRRQLGEFSADLQRWQQKKVVGGGVEPVTEEKKVVESEGSSSSNKGAEAEQGGEKPPIM